MSSSSRPASPVPTSGFLLTDVFAIPPLNMSKAPHSGFTSKTSDLLCRSDVLIPDPVHPGLLLGRRSTVLISATSCCCGSSLFLSASKQCSINALTTVLCTCLFLLDTPPVHITPDTFLQQFQPARTHFAPHSLLLWTVDLRCLSASQV